MKDEPTQNAQRLEGVAVALGETGALVRAHERPRAVALDALHEQVGNPQAVEEVARTHLLRVGRTITRTLTQRHE